MDPVSAAPDAGQRRRILRAAAGAVLLVAAAAGPAARARVRRAPPAQADADGAAPGLDADAACAAWDAWQDFQATFLGDGERVIDRSSERAVTVSEGQAYALFFALVAGDRARFERLLRWTEDNLAGGDLSRRLPAWQWGRRDDGGWGVLDANAAADADLWMVYALGEAGRLWRDRRYLALSSLLAERVLQEETAVLPGLGRTLLPGPQGFAATPGAWRLNPCYLPPFLARWLVTRSADPRWADVLAANLRLLREAAPRGYAPDWAWYRSAAAQPGSAPAADASRASVATAPPPAGFDTAPAQAADRRGSYDAVRVYLWLGLTAADDPDRPALLAQFAPMAERIERDGVVPRVIDVVDGSVQGAGPPGFCAALLPFLEAQQRPRALREQLARLRAQPVPREAYFEQALQLFALGWRAGRFRFLRDGSLVPAWQECPR
jgi:endoglucanase